MKKVAVITGASSGIGRKFVEKLKQFSSEYEELWVIARNLDNLNELTKVTEFPIRSIALDLSQPESFKVYEDLLMIEKPDIRLLINASGFGKFEAVMDTKLSDNLNMIDVNVKALTAITVLSVPYMSEGSNIIQIASVAGLQPIPYIDVYAATKAYVISFARALNQELNNKGIHVLALCPFWTKTKFFNRAIEQDKKQIVKKYVVMYEPEFIVDKAFGALRKKKDICIPGFVASAQAFLCKMLPHKLVMKIWMNQQSL